VSYGCDMEGYEQMQRWTPLRVLSGEWLPTEK
jgi:hypothetical protein